MNMGLLDDKKVYRFLKIYARLLLPSVMLQPPTNETVKVDTFLISFLYFLNDFRWVLFRFIGWRKFLKVPTRFFLQGLRYLRLH